MADELRHVPIQWCWDQIKPWLEKFHAKLNPRWRIEDVYAECLAERAFVWMAADGFVVLQPLTDRWDNGAPVLHVWIAMAYSGNVATDIFRAHQDRLDELARSHGMAVMTFDSPIAAWGRRLPQIGDWSVRTVTYARRVPPLPVPFVDEVVTDGNYPEAERVVPDLEAALSVQRQAARLEALRDGFMDVLPADDREMLQDLLGQVAGGQVLLPEQEGWLAEVEDAVGEDQ